MHGKHASDQRYHSRLGRSFCSLVGLRKIYLLQTPLLSVIPCHGELEKLGPRIRLAFIICSSHSIYSTGIVARQTSSTGFRRSVFCGETVVLGSHIIDCVDRFAAFHTIAHLKCAISVAIFPFIPEIL